MSADYYLFRCTGCDFTDLHSTGVTYEYQGYAEQEPAIGFGWCEACDAIVNTAGPYAEVEAHAAPGALERDLASLNSRATRTPSSPEQTPDKEKIEQAFNLIYKRLNYFQNHAYPIRCIICSSREVVSFELPPKEIDASDPIHIQHTCGGELMLSPIGQIPLSSHVHIMFYAGGETIASDIIIE